MCYGIIKTIAVIRPFDLALSIYIQRIVLPLFL